MSTGNAIYEKWNIQRGSTIRFQTNTKPWLPRGSNIVTFEPQFVGTPFTGGVVNIVDNIVQQLITCSEDASLGEHEIRVDLTNTVGEVDHQSFILLVSE